MSINPLSDPENGGISWRSVSNALIAISIAIGGWAWSDTTKDLMRLREQNELKTAQVATLTAQQAAQLVVNAELRVEIRRLGDKIDGLSRLITEDR